MKGVSKFGRRRSARDGIRPVCKACEAAKSSGYWGLNPDKRAHNTAAGNAAKAQRRLDYVTLRGGECQLCGYDSHPEILSLHHPDPSAKEHKLNAAMWTGGPKGKLVAKEADTTILLCPNCHMEVHHHLRNGGDILAERPDIKTPAESTCT